MEVDVRRVGPLVAQPQRDNGGVNSRVKQPHRLQCV
jgi:hypothetical protein